MNYWAYAVPWLVKIDQYMPNNSVHIIKEDAFIMTDRAVDFLHEVLDMFSFPIQAVQTDWGTEFFNDHFQKELMKHFIKFRPIKPRSPHLNGNN